METTTNKILLSWIAPEFIYHPKTRTWFASLWIVATGLFLATILMKNYFFALLVPIASFLIHVHAKKRPRQITVEIGTERISTSARLSLSHKEISSFWIFEEPENKGLHLETKKILQPKIFLPLNDQEPSALRAILINSIKEKKPEENFTDIIARKLNF